MEELMQQLDPNHGVIGFYRLTGAVLVANILTVWFVWAAWNYSRREQEGRDRGSGIYVGIFALVMLIAAGALIV